MLKWFALLFMTLDHIGYYFQPVLPTEVYFILRCIGRLAFPIFAFYVAKGFTRTRNPFHYLYRMASWALITHFALSAVSLFTGRIASVFSIEWTNVLVLFTFSITMLIGYDLAMRSYHDMIVSMTPISDTPLKLKETRFDVKMNPGGISLSPRIGVPVGIAMILISFWGVLILHSDYEFYGLLTVLFMYISYQKEKNSVHLSTLFFLLCTLNAGYILFAVITQGYVTGALMQALSIFSIFLFPCFGKDKKKPGFWGKYFFYFYYPFHQIVLMLLVYYKDPIFQFIVHRF